MRRFLPGLHFFFLLGSNGRLDEGAGGGGLVGAGAGEGGERMDVDG